MIVLSAIIAIVSLLLYVAICHIHLYLHRGPRPELVNKRIVGLFLLMIGLSVLRWSRKHSEHHARTDNPFLDPDIQFIPLFRLHPAQARSPWTKLQHLYCWPLYSLTLLGMVLGGWMSVVIGKDRRKRYSLGERLKIATESMIGPLVLVTFCCVFLGWPRGIIFFLTIYLVTGLLLGMTFQVTHCSQMRGEDLDKRWTVHSDSHTDMVLAVTLDTAPNSSVIAFFSGSLNRHVAHHLRPRDGSKALAEHSIVLQADERYRYVQSIPSALLAHYRFMRTLAAMDDDHAFST